MRAENQDLAANNSRCQGNQHLRSLILMDGKKNQVTKYVEGTRSNELVHNDSGRDGD